MNGAGVGVPIITVSSHDRLSSGKKIVTAIGVGIALKKTSNVD